MITIRNIQKADKKAILSIHKQAIYGICKDYYTEKEMKAWTDRLTPSLFDEGIKDDNNIGVVAVESAIIVGYGFFNLRDRELRALYVLPQFTNKGAGKLIMARLENIALKTNVKKLTLQSTINAVGFYQKLGYQIIKAERHSINEEVSIDCVLMERLLA